MKRQFTHNKLEHMAVPSVEMKQHQLYLRRALLASAQDKPTLRKYFQKGWKTYMAKKPIAVAGATLAMAVVALGAVALIVPQGSTASAQTDAKNSIKAVSSLSDEQRTQLEQRVGFDMSERLEAAKDAKDLESLSYDELSSKYPILAGSLPTGLPKERAGATDYNVQNLKFLKYKDAQGYTVLIGLDDKKLPVFASIGAGSEMGSPSTQQGEMQGAPHAPGAGAGKVDLPEQGTASGGE